MPRKICLRGACWSRALHRRILPMSPRPVDPPLTQLLRATVAPRDGARAAARARLLPALSALPIAAADDLHLAAALGDADGVRRLLQAEPALPGVRARAPGGPFSWDPLTHLCFSVLLDAPDRPDRDFVGAAAALLDAGADASTGFTDPKAEPGTGFRSLLYGAAALARHAKLTALLLAHGADPNDEEVAYHSPEGYENAALQSLVQSGRCSPDTLATMLLRKCDWHDVKGVSWLLEHGADASSATRWTPSILQHAVSRDNDLEILQLLLDHGADPNQLVHGVSAIMAAARAGRGDVLDAMARRGIPLRIGGGDALLAACARGHGPAVRTIAETLPAALDEVHAMASRVMARFAGNGNSGGLRLLLELGLPVDVRLVDGEGYFDIAPMSTPLHIAAWRGHPAAVRVLLAARGDVRAEDGAGRTPLTLAVRACVDSYWTDRRSPESVELLIAAGATTSGVTWPCGYDAVDTLLAAAGT